MPKKAAEPAKSEPTEETGVPIVVRRAMMKDDAATAPPDASETADAGNPLEVKSKKARIEPLTPEAEESDPESPVPAEKPTPAKATTAVAAKPIEPATPAVEPTTPAPTPNKKAVEDEAKPTERPSEFTLAGEDSVDTPDDPSQNPIDQAKAKADKEAAEKQAALDKLVDAQTYFLPLNSVEKRRTKQLFFVTLLLLVVLAGAGAFWANGQGYLSIPGL